MSFNKRRLLFVFKNRIKDSLARADSISSKEVGSLSQYIDSLIYKKPKNSPVMSGAKSQPYKNFDLVKIILNTRN